MRGRDNFTQLIGRERRTTALKTTHASWRNGNRIADATFDGANFVTDCLAGGKHGDNKPDTQRKDQHDRSSADHVAKCIAHAAAH